MSDAHSRHHSYFRQDFTDAVRSKNSKIKSFLIKIRSHMATAMQTRLILQKLKKSITKPNHIVSPYHEEIQNLVIQDLISTCFFKNNKMLTTNIT